MARGNLSISQPRIMTAMAGVALGVTVVAALYFAHAIFIPLALAVFLTFILAPVVNLLQRWRLGRTPAVVVTALLAGALLFGIGWVVSHQIAGLVESVQRENKYKANIRTKTEAVRQWMQSGVMGRARQWLQQVEQGRPRQDDETSPEKREPPSTPKTASAPTAEGGATAAELAAPSYSDFSISRLPELLGRVAEPLAQAALVFVLVIFMLARREDLRNRLIRLIGHGRLTVTTKAVDDAGHRVSRFLFVQMLVNVCYGVTFGIGLYLLNVDYAFLWGFLAVVMRYVPYVGIWVAVLPPVALSLAGSAGWTQPLWVVGLVAVMEIVTANFVEPPLFGQSIGVSEVALLLAAAFWAWLWGPVGLVLSAPLTVCLVVLGKYVPQLEFFDILLGDSPVLPPRLMFYQRLLAHDPDEASDVVEQAIQSAPREQVYDDLLIPALNSARRDYDRGDLADQDHDFVVGTVRETAEELAEREPVPADSGTDRAADEPRIRILGCPSRDATDELALHLFRDLLDPVKWAVEVLSPAALSSELLESVDQIRPAAVCIAALPPGGQSHTRYLCKRLRQRFPSVKILVGLWGWSGDVEGPRRTLADAGADATVTTLATARVQLTEWLAAFRADAIATDRPKEHERVGELV